MAKMLGCLDIELIIILLIIELKSRYKYKLSSLAVRKKKSI